MPAAFCLHYKYKYNKSIFSQPALGCAAREMPYNSYQLIYITHSCWCTGAVDLTSEALPVPEALHEGGAMRRSRTPSALAASLQGKAPAAADAVPAGASAEQADAPAAKRPRFVAPSRLGAAAPTAQTRPALAPLAIGSTSAADIGDRQYYTVLYTKRSNKVGCSARSRTGQHTSRRPAYFSNRSV